LPSWQDCEANRRGLLRQLNERIAEVAAGIGLERGGWLRFVCECGNDECVQVIELTLAEYEAVRAHARRFAIAPDHENPMVEVVTGQTSRFAVAETFVGEASRIPEETDPRGQVGRELHLVEAVGATSSAGLDRS
jgi:hypothetical protein